MKNCVVCGREIETGIACDQCDPPRGSKTELEATGEPRRAVARLSASRVPASNVVPFPKEGREALLQTAWDVLSAANIPAAVIARNGIVRFISDPVRAILGINGDGDLTRLDIEQRIGWKLPELSETLTSTVEIGGREIEFSLVPLSEGSQGSVLIFQPSETTQVSALDKVVAPLRALRLALAAVDRHRETSPLLDDTAHTIDRILGSLEDEANAVSSPPRTASIEQIIQQVADRYSPIARLKEISLEVDVPPLDNFIENDAGLRGRLEALVENSFHYVPAGGQIFIGARTTEHKKRKLALFFVMDNGPMVPEHLRKKMFERDFDSEAEPERTGRRLHECFDFATRHGGQCWVECKIGKSCTFFLSIRLA